jgi:hypothetical protein
MPIPIAARRPTDPVTSAPLPPGTEMRNGVLVATTSNRLSSSGDSAPTTSGQSAKVIATTIAAGVTIPFAAAGTNFYFAASSASLQVRQAGGEFIDYVQGTGYNKRNNGAFASIEVKNTNSFPVAFQMFVGFDEFIDKRIFNVNTTTPNVAYPTYSIPLGAVAVAITDLSGQGFFDIDGNPWLALSRIAIVISNLDTANTLLVQKEGSVIQNGPAIAAVFPLTSWIEPLSGDFSLNIGGGNINALVHEIYQAIPPSGLTI